MVLSPPTSTLATMTLSPESASALGDFLRAHRRTEVEWTITDTHNPGRGSRDCVVCGEPWPCAELRGLAVGWRDQPGWRPEWA